jgi:hypothetical protein
VVNENNLINMDYNKYFDKYCGKNNLINMDDNK